MRCRGLGTALFGGCLLLLLVGGVARAKDPPGDAVAFGKAIERLHQDCRKEKFKSGLCRLSSLLDRHAKQPYARARRIEIEDLAERFAFGAAHKAPRVEDVLSGRIEKFDAGKGYLKLVIKENEEHDLQRIKGGLLALPMKVNGPFLLEIRGSSYPPSADDAPRVVLAGDTHPRTRRPQSWLMVFGTPPRTQGNRETWMPASITYLDGKTKKVLDQKDVVSIPVEKAYRLQVQGSASQLKITVNGKTLCKGRKPKKIWGYLAFEARDWTKLTFTGTIESAWIQDRLDKAVLAQRKTFEKTWNPKNVLPSWLYEGADRITPPIEHPTLPAEVARKLHAKVRRIQRLVERSDWAGAEEQLDGLRKAQVPESVCAYLAACMHAAAGRLNRALAEIDRCLAVAPGFLDGVLLRIEVLRRLGRRDDVLVAVKAAMTDHPRDPVAYETATVELLLSGCIREAQRATEQAIAHGVHSPVLDLLGKAVVRAERGPTWNKVYEYKSQNYHVVSDIDKKTCIAASRVLEAALTSYRVNFEWVKSEKNKRYKVYLFSGQRGFMNYMAELQGLMGKPSDQAAGLYSSLLKQLLIWNLPDHDAMMETVRHEGFHQYLDRLMDDVPVWFNEGMAVYHENGRMVRGRLAFGQMHPEYVSLLETRGIVPLEKFLYFSPKKFYAGGAHSYAQAWALIHMLRKGKSPYRALFKKIVKALQGDAPTESIALLLPKEQVDALERDLKAYIKGLGAP